MNSAFIYTDDVRSLSCARWMKLIKLSFVSWTLKLVHSESQALDSDSLLDEPHGVFSMA